MDYLLVINFVASIIAFAGLTYAMFSHHVRDGILVKKGLALMAIGFAANAFVPSFHSQIWIVCSFALLLVFIALRFVQARIHHTKPVLLVF